MDFASFIYGHVTPNFSKYISVLILTAIVFTVVYKCVICDGKEIFILWGNYFGEIFSIADVQFMYMENLISEYYYINFLVTTIVLYISILGFQKLFSIKTIYRNRVKKATQHLSDEKNIIVIKHYSTLLFIAFVALSILKWIILGIGRAGLVKKGGGTGVMSLS